MPATAPRAPRLARYAVGPVVLGVIAAAAVAPACGSGSIFGRGGDGGLDDGYGNLVGHDGGPPKVACPAGLECNVTCPGGGSTTISGVVYDPAGKDPLYDVAVYVPALALQPLPRGVPTGAAQCDCGALYASGSIAGTSTAVDGSFTITNAPVGTSVPLVVQIGKWRRVLHVDVAACTDNAQPEGSLTLPSTLAGGDPDDSMPDIAVSTGQADTLECLLRRMGLPVSEYVAGDSPAGHVHVFLGGDYSDDGYIGRQGIPPPDLPPSGAPPSALTLWATASQLMPYDLVLLSCEGGETFEANPEALEAYLNVGGRVFASHYHYAWFAGAVVSHQTYVVPADWGDNLARWPAAGAPPDAGVTGGSIVQTLNGTNATFTKGKAMDQWLSGLGALGQNGVPAGQLSLFSPRFDAQVTPSNKASQPWISAQEFGVGYTMYFSFDTPVESPAGDGAPPTYCGRAVFSDLHVSSGNPASPDKLPTPEGCLDTDLSPQEKALEFMIFDLSSCVVADTVPPVGLPGN